jgi:hypothetical protein
VWTRESRRYEDAGMVNLGARQRNSGYERYEIRRNEHVLRIHKLLMRSVKHERREVEENKVAVQSGVL